MWVIPSDLTSAIDAVTKGFAGESDYTPGASSQGAILKEGEQAITDTLRSTALPDLDSALADAKDEAGRATTEATESGTRSGHSFDPGAEAGQRPNLPGE